MSKNPMKVKATKMFGTSRYIYSYNGEKRNQDGQTRDSQALINKAQRSAMRKLSGK